jgi:hypothetical protein
LCHRLQASLRGAIGVVPQDTVLFNDTILYNIRRAPGRLLFAACIHSLQCLAFFIVKCSIHAMLGRIGFLTVMVGVWLAWRLMGGGDCEQIRTARGNG